MDVSTLQAVLEDIVNNAKFDVVRSVEFQNQVSKEAGRILDTPGDLTEYDLIICDLILRISNIMYNQTSDTVLPLDDGLYDRLIIKYRQYNPNYQVGSTSIKQAPNEQAENERLERKVMCRVVEKDPNNLFYDPLYHSCLTFNELFDVGSNNRNMHTRRKQMCTIVREPIKKRLINTQHKYPQLVGTLDKCKCVLNEQARELGIYDDKSVDIFERDYIHKCMDMGIIRPDEEFMMVGELKYDGVSVEAEIENGRIKTALSRGDTGDNVATDLTPILGGYRFDRAIPDLSAYEPFGIKFEAVMFKRDIERLSAIRGKAYKNGRNAIIGLLGSSDAWRFRDYITLIPIATSLDFSEYDGIPRIAELEFLNAFYNSGELNRYCVFKGDYRSILFQVKQFTEAAEMIRPILPYMIDGVVISFLDEDKKAALGRDNSVNKYQMAIKFIPKKARTVFLGYTFNIGKTGEVIPMAHFKPCEFIGGIHNKQTIHSYQRFKELDLRIGDQIDIEYRNEVITYVTKPDTEYNRNNSINPPVEFPKVCPFCGGPIEISQTGKSAKCSNPNCGERIVGRMTAMLENLGFEGFSEEAVRALGIKSFADLINLDEVKTAILGPNESIRMLMSINNILNNPINDFRLMSAIGFDGMGDEKWKRILEHYTIAELIQMDNTQITNNLSTINGIGPGVINTIISGLISYGTDIGCALNVFKKIINTKGQIKKPKIAITGTRDQAIIAAINNAGFDCADNYGVTKDLAALVAKDKNSGSTKIQKAQKYGIPVYSVDEFIEINNINV